MAGKRSVLGLIMNLRSPQWWSHTENIVSNTIQHSCYDKKSAGCHKGNLNDPHFYNHKKKTYQNWSTNTISRNTQIQHYP